MSVMRAVMLVSGLVLVLAPPALAMPEVAPQESALPVVDITHIEMATTIPNTLGFWVKVHNAGPTNLPAQLFFGRVGEATTLPHLLQVPAKGDTSVLVVDRTDRMNCGLAYDMRLVGNRANPATRMASLDVACTFEPQVEDSLSSMTADQRQRQTSGKVLVEKISSQKFLSCGALNLKADVYNGSSITATGLEAAVHDAYGKTVWVTAVPAVAPGGRFVVDMNHVPFDGAAQKFSLVVQDPQNKMAGRIAAQSVGVQIQPACSAVARLNP